MHCKATPEKSSNQIRSREGSGSLVLKPQIAGL
jgi:hypothetical protein